MNRRTTTQEYFSSKYTLAKSHGMFILLKKDYSEIWVIAQYLLNNRSRKTLGYLTPNEVFNNIRTNRNSRTY